MLKAFLYAVAVGSLWFQPSSALPPNPRGCCNIYWTFQLGVRFNPIENSYDLIVIRLCPVFPAARRCRAGFRVALRHPAVGAAVFFASAGKRTPITACSGSNFMAYSGYGRISVPSG
jgi:hypothetical protein